MIRYSLICGKGHEFEGWFKNSAEFDRHEAGHSVACPVCGSAEVGKAIMAPSLGRTGASEVAVPRPVGEKLRVAAPDPRRAALMEALREVRKAVTADADYVGGRFPEEARKIHYKEVEPRGIFGEATPDEAKSLAEEGIEFHALPVLPEDLS